MDVSTALRARHSSRDFSDRPIPDDVLAAILRDTAESPSWSNTQPWRLGVLSGAALDALRGELVVAAQGQVPNPDFPQLFEYPPLLQQRRRATGFGLYGVLGIDKGDHAARAAQYEKNHLLFGAPTGVFLFCHRALAEYAVLDAGIALMALLLAATAHGVQSCAQAVLAAYPDIVKQHLDLTRDTSGDDDEGGYNAADWLLLCGVALGYETDAVENTFRPARASVAALTIPPRTR